MIRLICHLQQKDLGHGAMDNPIYRFAIFCKFLWLLGPLSHRFVDCLLSWALMSCCLNHCIITALIHFLACPHSHLVCGLATVRKEWYRAQLCVHTIRTIILESKFYSLINNNPLDDMTDCCHKLLFQVARSSLVH